MKKIAVILFNLGGPDSPKAVWPFLFNLFNDPAIIRLPAPFRQLIAALISTSRNKKAQGIYAHIGGRSPILPNTEAQRDALDQALGENFKAFIAMRYWHPFTDEAARAVRDFAPDEIILLPLYPQFSTTTSASSLREWEKQARRAGLTAPSKTICCYPDESGFIEAMAASARAAFEAAKAHGSPRFLFSAHGLPEKIIRAGDPYQIQCALTAAKLASALNAEDWELCYQSRVGPLKWIGPSTEDEIRRAGADKVPLVVVPIAFVSDHSETLVEIDIEYRHLAGQVGVPYFASVRPVGSAPKFIAALAGIVRRAAGAEKICTSACGERICPAQFPGCGSR